jgi:hypothetical protein
MLVTNTVPYMEVSDYFDIGSNNVTFGKGTKIIKGVASFVHPSDMNLFLDNYISISK